MSSEICRKKWLGVLAVALWSWGSPIHAQNLMHDFETLFERCRVSVEMSSEFDNEGLHARNVEDRHARDWGMNSHQEGWMQTGSELYVVRTEWTSQDGTSRQLCQIKLADQMRILDPIEQALLLRHFLIIKVELIGAGTHEVDKQLSPIPPLVNAGFLLSDRSPSGCKVINIITLSPDGTFFSAGSGEQAIKPCKAD